MCEDNMELLGVKPELAIYGELNMGQRLALASKRIIFRKIDVFKINGDDTAHSCFRQACPASHIHLRFPASTLTPTTSKFL